VTAEELKAEIGVEFAALRQVVSELDALRLDVAGRAPTVREKTAAAAFLAQFYSGIENILKRLSRFHGVELPVAGFSSANANKTSSRFGFIRTSSCGLR
jgi:hypothetical protein